MKIVNRLTQGVDFCAFTREANSGERVPLICVNLPAARQSAHLRERTARSRVLISLTCLPLLSSAQTQCRRRANRKTERALAEAAPNKELEKRESAVCVPLLFQQRGVLKSDPLNGGSQKSGEISLRALSRINPLIESDVVYFLGALSV